MTDNIVQESSWQLSYPMLFVSEESVGICIIAQLVTPDAFHMNRRATQIAVADQGPHPPGNIAELCIMPGGQFASARFRERNKLFGFGTGQSKRLFNVNVTAVAQAHSRNFKVALRRGCDMDHVGQAALQ